MKRKTNEQYLKEVFDVWGEEYSILGEYKNQREKILVRHNICGREYLAYPDNLIKGHGCSECYKKNKLNKDKRTKTEDIIDYIKKYKNNEFELIDHYFKNGISRIKVKHFKCNTISDFSYPNFRNSCGCIHCSKDNRSKTRTKTTEQFQKELDKLFNNEYSVLSEYTGVKEKVKISHNKCNSVFCVTPTYALRKRYTSLCPVCGKQERADNNSISNEEFLSKVNKIWGNEYTPLEEYRRNNIKIKVRHNNCGNEYKVVPSSLLSKNGCPLCCMLDSKACKEIESFLKNKNIPYQREFKIKECKYKYPLPFDFAIFSSGELKMLIEYDGEQHFKPIKYFGGDKNFELRKIRDKIKDEYCLKNNIKLLRIPYNKENEIKEILTQELL